MGYDNRRLVGALVRKARRTRPALTVAAALGDLVITFGSCIAASLTIRHHGVTLVTAGVVFLALIVAARGLRGSECLVHEASHYNWSRNRLWNDLLADVLSAWLVFTHVASYRAQHDLHHRKFGNPDIDPDLRRYEELDLEQLDRASAGALLTGVVRRLPRYVYGWYLAIGTHFGATGRSLGMHAFLVAFGLLALPSSLVALIWLNWCLAFFIVLPFVRLVAEASEHIYTGSLSVFDATVSNTGKLHRVLLHPHNDGYHVTHHLWPQVPHHALRHLDDGVRRADTSFGTSQRVRRRVLDRV
jgi:fatty acid desaturase